MEWLIWIWIAILFLAAIIIFVQYRKEDKIFYVVSGFFLFWGIWRILDATTQINFFEGVYLLIFRVISAIVLVLMGITYYRLKKSAKPNK